MYSCYFMLDILKFPQSNGDDDDGNWIRILIILFSTEGKIDDSGKSRGSFGKWRLIVTERV